MLLRFAKPWYERILRDEAGDGDGDGSGGGGDGDGSGGGADDFDARLAKETAGLRANRDKLLKERKADQKALNELQTQLDAVGGADGLKQLAELNERLQKDEMGKLLAEGKSEEWYEKRSAASRKAAEKQIETITAERDEAIKGRDEITQRLHGVMLDNQANSDALASGVLPEVVDDVKMWIRNTFQWSDEHDSPVTLDNDGQAIIGKDGSTPMGIAEWIEGQKETKRYWWAPSKGGGAGGSGGNRGGNSGGYDGLSPAEFQKKFEADSKSRGG